MRPDHDRDRAADAAKDPRRVFDDPLTLAEMTDLPYETRLELLNRWLALSAADGEGEAAWKEVMGAILALEGRSELEMDEPSGAPEDRKYGVVDRHRPEEH